MFLELRVDHLVRVHQEFHRVQLAQVHQLVQALLDHCLDRLVQDFQKALLVLRLRPDLVDLVVQLDKQCSQFLRFLHSPILLQRLHLLRLLLDRLHQHDQVVREVLVDLVDIQLSQRHTGNLLRLRQRHMNRLHLLLCILRHHLQCCSCRLFGFWLRTRRSSMAVGFAVGASWLSTHHSQST